MTVLSHRIRLDLNDVQRTWMERCAGTARKAFNWGLGRWQEMYKAGEKPSWQNLNAELNAIKAIEFPWMTRLPWKVTNGALSDLGNAFTHFFHRVKASDRSVGYPQFKKKGRGKESFALDGREIVFDGKKIRIPKLGWIRLREPLRFPGKVLGVRFSKHADHWYVSVQVEIDESRWFYPHRCETQATVGVDLGVVDLAVLSNGTKIEAPRALRIHEKRLRMLQKELSRRTKGGSNWKKTKSKVGKLYERNSNVRKDVIHKLTTGLVQDFRWIGVENLNVKGMAQGRLAKSVLDAAMAEVSRQLTYKAPLAGSTVVVANRWFPSSKTCSDCGHIVKSLPLNIREWTCEACGVIHDRDVNAAINLKNLALAQRVTACRQGSSGLDPVVRTKLPLGQESGSEVNLS